MVASDSDASPVYGLLIVDDEPAICESLELTLGGEYRTFTASSGEEGLAVLEAEDIACVIADQVMPGMNGVEFLEQVRERAPATIRMMLTGYADLPSLVRAINESRIYRYIPKPWEPDELRLDVRRALESYALERKNERLAAQLASALEKLQAENVFLRREAGRRYSFDGIIGESPAMQRVFDLTQKVAETATTVLLTGETGTGKDVIARAVHYSGERRERPFVAQNCGALPDTLLESELFGHKRGAFTGATEDKKGLFEAADGGTIFLDEIGETQPSMQVRLLRVLQDGEIRPLGGSQSRRVDVRVVAATNRDLVKEVEEGGFREDLFYRLKVVEIQLPPLRARSEDIPALAHQFLDRANERMGRQLTGFTNSAMDLLVAAPWPGNVRQLENEIERAVALSAADAPAITGDSLSAELRQASVPAGRSVPVDIVGEDWDLNGAVERLKARMIREALRAEGSKSGAAQRLGIPRQSLQKMIKRLAISDEGS
jgi:two-component system response regulator HupR/HoxA